MAFAISASDRLKYDNVFAHEDREQSGRLGGKAVVELLTKSGLEKQVRRRDPGHLSAPRSKTVEQALHRSAASILCRRHGVLALAT